jgi:hypothetical protein
MNENKLGNMTSTNKQISENISSVKNLKITIINEIVDLIFKKMDKGNTAKQQYF